MTTPEIFTSHDLEWYTHNNDGKMPCKATQLVEVLLKREFENDEPLLRVVCQAVEWDWSIQDIPGDIKGWRPVLLSSDPLPR